MKKERSGEGGWEEEKKGNNKSFFLKLVPQFFSLKKYISLLIFFGQVYTIFLHFYMLSPCGYFPFHF